MRTLHCLALLAMLAAIPACGRDGKPTPGPVVAKAKGGKIRLAFISNNPAEFWTIAQKGTEKAAEELKDVEVEFRMPSQNTAQNQQEIIEDLMTKGVQGIAVSPNNPDDFVTFLKNQVNSKIPLLTVDSDIPDPSARRCYLGTDNYRAGMAVGELVQKAVPKGGKIAIFVGKLDVRNAVERRQGVLDQLRGSKNKEIGKIDPFDAADMPVGTYTLVATKTDEVNANICQKHAEDLLTKNADIVCLVGLWAYNPPALLEAVKAANKVGKVAVVGFDEDFQTLDGIMAKSIYGTVHQDPLQFGYESMKILAGLAKGDADVFKSYTMDDQKRIFVAHRVKTAADTAEVKTFYDDLKKILSK